MEISPINAGGLFHDVSEAMGFIYSLQFTRKGDAATPYFTAAEVDGLLQDLLSGGPDGLWNITPAILDNVSNSIAAKFDFTVAQAK